MVEYDDLTANQRLDIFPALEDVERLNTLIYLNNGGPSPHQAVADFIDIGINTYTRHINKLMKVGLAEPDYDSNPKEYNSTMETYVKITELGKAVLRKFC